MQVNALQFKNQMETFGSRNGDQMGPWAAESRRYVRNVFLASPDALEVIVVSYSLTHLLTYSLSER